MSEQPTRYMVRTTKIDGSRRVKVGREQGGQERIMIAFRRVATKEEREKHKAPRIIETELVVSAEAAFALFLMLQAELKISDGCRFELASGIKVFKDPEPIQNNHEQT